VGPLTLAQPQFRFDDRLRHDGNDRSGLAQLEPQQLAGSLFGKDERGADPKLGQRTVERRVSAASLE